MRRRILGAIVASTAAALLGFGIPLAVTIQNRYRDEALLRLSAAAAAAAVNVPSSYARDNDQPELPDSKSDIDLALYDPSGRRVVGVGPDRADIAITRSLRTSAGSQDRSGLVVTFPIAEQERVTGVIRASTPKSVVERRVVRAWFAMGGLATTVFAAATLLAIRRSRTLAEPLNDLRSDANTIGGGGQVASRPNSGIPEIDAVHHAFVDAATRLTELVSREQAFSADLAHQLRTPLSSLRLRLETEQLNPDADHELLADALRDLDRLEATIDDLVALARDVIITGDPRPLASLVKDAVAGWRDTLSAGGRDLRVALAPELPYVTARPEAVRQILDVLLANATTHGTGTVTVTGTRVGNGAVLAVSDEGTATIDPTSIFERRSPNATGTGIGLALARRLAEAEKLRLVVAHPGPGATFHLVFAAREGHSPSA